MYLKKKKDVSDIIWFIVIFGVLAAAVGYFAIIVIKIVFQVGDLIKELSNMPWWLSLLVIGTSAVLICIIWFWDKRDDFFYFVASILSKPSEYFYIRKKEQLLNYRSEIKKLVASIEYFSNIDSEKITKEDFWKFAEDVSRQNERLEKNRIMLEQQDNRINIWIQLFILICGVMTSLIL